MRQEACDKVRDRLPGVAIGSLPEREAQEVQEHLRGCAGCRAELDLIQAVRGVRERAPDDLAARIQTRIRRELLSSSSRLEMRPKAGRGKASRGWGAVIPLSGRRRWISAGALSAAAVAVLALGTGVLWNGSPSDPGQVPVAVASQEPLPEAWLWDDGMVAGAPVFDDLSDEDLEVLVEEFGG